MAISLSNYDPAVQQGATVTVSASMAQIADTNSNESIRINATTDAVNFLASINSATTVAVQLNAEGDDTNIDFKLKGKGTGGIILNQGGTTTTIACDIVSTGLTTGKVIDMSDLSAITTGKAIHVDATGITHTDGILVHIDSAGTVITSTGRLFLSDHTGVTTTSGILNEFKSAANDETVVFQVNATAALALGKVVNIKGAAVTTGTLLDISDNTAHTTGTAVNIVTNSADTGTRTLLNIKNDHASATGVTPLVITQDAPTSTNFKLMATFGTISLYISDQTSPNTALTAVEGSICLNGSATGQAFWNTDGSTAWTALA